MPVRRRRLGWWSPDPRGVLPVGGLIVPRSLRRSTRRYEIRVDSAFREVMVACATEPRPHGWITPELIDAYVGLHELGLAHSIETWSPQGELVGGLYGVSIGGLFAGESMFHRAVDASKVALVALVELLGPDPAGLLDVQWSTPHLASLGVIEIRRDEYLRRLGSALASPGAWGRPSATAE